MVREFSELPYNQFMSSWWEWLSRGVGMQTTVSTTVCEKNRDRPWGCTKPTGKLVAVTEFSAAASAPTVVPVLGGGSTVPTVSNMMIPECLAVPDRRHGLSW